jgi:tartrate dehydratase alpha subunit/fumarate hydratase class I-like protein
MKIHAGVEKEEIKAIGLGLGLTVQMAYHKLIVKVVPTIGNKVFYCVFIFCWDKECKLK